MGTDLGTLTPAQIRNLQAVGDGELETSTSNLRRSRTKSCLRHGLAIGLPGIIFASLTAWVWGKSDGIGWDAAILLAIHITAQPTLDGIAAFLTELGVYWGVFPAVGTIAIALIIRHQWQRLMFALLTAAGNLLLNRGLKLLIQRPRPHLWASPYPPEPSFSFPSGHAMSSMTLAIIVVVLSWKTRWRWAGVGFAALFVPAIAWTRLYLGVHYPSDLIAGWMLAIAWAATMHLLTASLYQQPRRKT